MRMRSSSSVRGTALLAFGNDGPGHGTLDVGPEARHPQPVMRDPAVEPWPEAEQFHLGDRARRQPVAAGLVAGELRGVDH